jgi:hypothetical protein
LLIAIVANEGLEIHHLDISTEFLYAELTDEVYIDIKGKIEMLGKIKW